MKTIIIKEVSNGMFSPPIEKYEGFINFDIGMKMENHKHNYKVDRKVFDLKTSTLIIIVIEI